VVDRRGQAAGSFPTHWGAGAHFMNKLGPRGKSDARTRFSVVCPCAHGAWAAVVTDEVEGPRDAHGCSDGITGVLPSPCATIWAISQCGGLIAKKPVCVFAYVFCMRACVESRQEKVTECSTAARLWRKYDVCGPPPAPAMDGDNGRDPRYPFVHSWSGDVTEKSRALHPSVHHILQHPWC
jgi:hypothetical protein